MRRTVPRIDILRYALAGAVTERGTGSGYLTDKEMSELNKDIAYIEKLIKAAEDKESKK